MKALAAALPLFSADHRLLFAQGLGGAGAPEGGTLTALVPGRPLPVLRLGARVGHRQPDVRDRRAAAARGVAG